MKYAVTGVPVIMQGSQPRSSDDYDQQMQALREENMALRRKNMEVGLVLLCGDMYSVQLI